MKNSEAYEWLLKTRDDIEKLKMVEHWLVEYCNKNIPTCRETSITEVRK